MFEKIFPEKAGVSSRHIYTFIERLNKRGMKMHSALFMKGDKLFSEFYWKPFHKDFSHRMYSVTKSFVSIAIGLLIDDGKIKLSDRVSVYFSDVTPDNMHENLKNQTVEQMLTMTTVGYGDSWFSSDCLDRAQFYFTRNKEQRAPGTVWAYDSSGSQVLSQLVERVSGKCLFDFLNERVFRHLGTFKEATMLKTRNGAAWGDSAMICTPRDLASFARFVMNYGKWNGKQLLSEEYLRKATSKLVDNVTTPHEGILHKGYGYQIWRTEKNGFAFVGMGDQLALCFPDYDVIFVCTADNQGSDYATEYIVSSFIDIVLENMESYSISDDVEGNLALYTIGENLELFALKGLSDSPLRDEINGVKFICSENEFGFKEFTFNFKNQYEGELCYVNKNGALTLPFCVNKNHFGKFPELGYSQDFGGLRTSDGSKYDCATSLGWLQENKILIYSQIIDRYFGNTSLTFAFNGDYATLSFDKTAEDFLWNYKGVAIAKRER